MSVWPVVRLLTVRVLIRQPVVFHVVVLKLAVHGAALLGPVVLVRVLTLVSVTHPELVVRAWAGAAAISRTAEDGSS